MIFIALCRVGVFAEAIVLLVIVVIRFATGPIRCAFNTEVIVGSARQFTVAIATFQKTLCKGYAGGNTMLLHLLHGNVLPLADVFLGSVPLRSKAEMQQGTCSDQQ